MSGFLKMAGFRGVTQSKLVEAVRELYGSKGWGFEEVPLAPGFGWESGQSNDQNLEHVGTCEGGSVMCFTTFSDVFIETSRELSKRLKAVTLVAQIYEGSQWSYQLMSSGKVVDQYINVPDYFGPASDGDLEKYRGRPELLAKYFPRVKESDVSKYLVRWTEDFIGANGGKKAYRGDAARYGDAWQMLDLLEKLGFCHPVDKRGRPTGTIFR
jgi:hypothetical protein